MIGIRICCLALFVAAAMCCGEARADTETDRLRDALRNATAQTRLEQLHEAGTTQARLYGENPADGVGGTGAFFLLLDEPEVYGLPPDPVVTTRDLPAMWRRAGVAAALLTAGVAVAFTGRRGSR